MIHITHTTIRTAASTERQVDPEVAYARLSTPLMGSPGRIGKKERQLYRVSAIEHAPQTSRSSTIAVKAN
jgi:hypothetical protein